MCLDLSSAKLRFKHGHEIGYVSEPAVNPWRHCGGVPNGFRIASYQHCQDRLRPCGARLWGGGYNYVTGARYVM
jgi:hypothetical protein